MCTLLKLKKLVVALFFLGFLSSPAIADEQVKYGHAHASHVGLTIGVGVHQHGHHKHHRHYNHHHDHGHHGHHGHHKYHRHHGHHGHHHHHHHHHHHR